MTGKSARILMAGGDLVGISAYVKLLQMEGFDACAAFNGADLLDVLSKKNFAFDLIITDVRIPGLSSYELGDYIAMNSGVDIPIMGIAELPRDEQHLMQSGESFAMIIEKGFTAVELVDAVESILNIDHSLGEGMSDQQVRNRAAQLQDTETSLLDGDDYIDAFHNHAQNYGHQTLMNQLKEE